VFVAIVDESGVNLSIIYDLSKYPILFWWISLVLVHR